MNSEHPTTFSRRHFLGSAALLSTGFLLSGSPLRAETLSPAQRLPVAFPHFPSRLHAFVWRNWNLVPIRSIARVTGATETQILTLGKTLGLAPPRPVSSEQWSRSYITIIRRNWHLLPKDQLKDLLGWTEEHLEFTLQEDDFLYIKLGSVKPDCEPVRWSELSADAKETEAWLQKTVKEEFSKPSTHPREDLFHFVKTLSSPTGQKAAPMTSGFSPRYGYGYFTLFGDPLLDAEIDPFPDGYLERMAASGLDGTWMHIVLSKVTPFPWDPTLSKDWEKRLANLKKLVEKAKKHGIGIYLYLNEPRYQPLAFYKKFPELKGVTRGEYAAMCTSHPEVKKYLTDSIAHIVSVVPDLAGFFSITASENPTHCWSHFQGDQCPRCSPRGPEKVIAELNTLYETGIRKGVEDYKKQHASYVGTGPRLIAWDWGWRDGWAEGIVPGLPSNTSLMSVSEWDLPIKRGGVDGKVGEYSISAIGPGPRAKRHWAVARQHGLKIIAKIQAGTTWECGGLPYVPALENVAQHAVNLREEKVSGLMTGWTLGGYPGSPNLEVVSVVGSDANISVEGAMQKVAQRRYGAAAQPVVEAWYGFSKAYREFPYHIGVVYNAPVHSGPANLLWEKPTGYASTMVGIGYDDLKKWRAIYPEEVFIDQLYKVAAGFEESVKVLRQKTKNLRLQKSEQTELDNEIRLAEAVAVLYRSVANQSEFIRQRDSLLTGTSGGEKQAIKSRLKVLLTDEIKLAKRLYELQSADSRIGFEASNHYFYIPDDLKEKVLNCRYLLDHWLKNV
jgi:hypothetical protein